MAAQNSHPSVGFSSHDSYPVRLSFQTRLSPDIDPNVVAIKVSLKFKRIMLWPDNEFSIYERIYGMSTISFPFRNPSTGPPLADYLGNKFHHWMPALSPSVCHRLSQDIVQYAHRVGVANGGAMLVKASMEVVYDEDGEISVPNFLSHAQVSSSKPRGLSGDEIKRLKEESYFKNGGDESVCSVCLEKFLPGGKDSPLPCMFSRLSQWLHNFVAGETCKLPTW